MIKRTKALAFFAASIVLELLITGCSKTITSGAPEEPKNPIEAALMTGDFPKAPSQAQASTDPAAKFFLGRMWKQGWGTDGVSTDKATRYYQDAAAAGYVRAKVFLAGIYLDRRNSQKAEKLFEEAAQQGDIQGKYIALKSSKTGKNMMVGDKSPFDQAFRAAADAGDPAAAMYLAEYFSQKSANGQLLDAKLSLKYLLIAASSNSEMPGALAAANLFQSGISLGGKASDLAPIIDRYTNAGGLAAIAYYSGCQKDRSNPFCDPVKVLTYGDAANMNGNLGLNRRYVASLPKQQVEEGIRLSKQWKPKKMLAVPINFYIHPELRKQFE